MSKSYEINAVSETLDGETIIINLKNTNYCNFKNKEYIYLIKFN